MAPGRGRWRRGRGGRGTRGSASTRAKTRPLPEAEGRRHTSEEPTDDARFDAAREAPAPPRAPAPSSRAWASAGLSPSASDADARWSDEATTARASSSDDDERDARPLDPSLLTDLFAFSTISDADAAAWNDALAAKARAASTARSDDEPMNHDETPGPVGGAPPFLNDARSQLFILDEKTRVDDLDLETFFDVDLRRPREPIRRSPPGGMMSPMAMRSAADVRDVEERALEAERDTREIRELFEKCNARDADIANEGLVARATGAVADRLDHDGVDARTLKLLFDDALRRTENTARTPLPAPAIRAMRALRPGMHAAFQLLQVADDDDDSRPIPILATRTRAAEREAKKRGVSLEAYLNEALKAADVGATAESAARGMADAQRERRFRRETLESKKFNARKVFDAREIERERDDLVLRFVCVAMNAHVDGAEPEGSALGSVDSALGGYYGPPSPPPPRRTRTRPERMFASLADEDESDEAKRETARAR
jgi:hypothetical protein